MFQRVITAVFLFSMLSGCSDKPIPDDLAIASAVSQSDDYSKHEKAFIDASKELLKNEKCSLNEFEEMGGWMKSTTTYKEEPVYFTYCGGMTISNRIYVNASTGTIFQ